MLGADGLSQKLKSETRMESRSKWPSTLLCMWIWGITLAVILTGRMVHSGFCIIDDHTQVEWLNDGLKFSNLWPTLLQTTEIGELGSGGRFRPVYYVYIELEAWLLGDRPSIYHALRVLYFGLFLAAAGTVAARCTGRLVATVVIAGIAGLSFWNNLWTWSLGPAEQIASIGVSLLLIAGATIVPRVAADAPVPAWALPLASFGVAIAAGSKENFAFLWGALAILIAAMATTRRLRPLSAALALLPMLVPALVLYALATAGRNTRDLYGVDNSVAHRFAILLNKPFYVLFAVGALALAIWLCSVARRHSTLSSEQLRRSTLLFLGLTGFLAAYILWEIFFYNGRLPSGIRYDFPFLLLPLAIVTGFAGFVRGALLLEEKPPQAVDLCFLIIAGSYFLVFNPEFSLPRAADQAVAATKDFRRDFLALQATAASHPTWPIVLEASLPRDYEVVVTFATWARFYKVKNPVVLRVEIPPHYAEGTFERRLMDRMAYLGKEGLPRELQPLPDPAALGSLGGDCFAAGMEKPPVSHCVPLSFAPTRYIPPG